MIVLIFLGILCSLLLITIMGKERVSKKAINKILTELEKKQIDPIDSSPNYIIFISYSSDNFKEIDSMLQCNCFESSIVFLDAPSWLAQVKKKTWANSIIITRYSENFYDLFNENKELNVIKI